MQPVPETKLRGDLLLELRDVRLEINKEKEKLEILQRQRAEAESGLQARENKVKTREEVNDRLEKKFNLVAGDAEKYHQNVTKYRIKEQDNVKKLSKKLQKILDDTVIAEESRLSSLKQLDQEIQDKIAYGKSLQKKIVLDSLLLEAIKKETKELLEKNDFVKNESERIAAKLSEREI